MNQQEIIDALKRYGVDKKEYEKLSLEELKSLYERYEKESIKRKKALLGELMKTDSKILAVTTEDDEEEGREDSVISEYLDEVKEIIRSKRSPYEFLEKIIKKLTQKELDILADAIENLSGSEHFLFALRAKKHELIYGWIDDIESALKDVSDAERFTVLKDIKSEEVSIDFVKELHKKLTDPKIRDEFIKVANFRNMLIDGFLNGYKSEAYKEYFEETIYKQEYIDKILKVTKNYTKEHLQEKKLNDLKNIFEHYKKEYERIKKEKEAVKKYIKLFKEAIEKKFDERELNKLMGNMFIELNEDGVQKIIDALADASPTISERIRISFIESYAKKR